MHSDLYNEWENKLHIDLNKQSKQLAIYLDKLRNIDPLDLTAHCDNFNYNPIVIPNSSIAYQLQLDECIDTEKNRRFELYHKAKSVIEETFKLLLEKRHGFTWQSKQTEKIWDLAWEYGHPAGWYGILKYYDDLAELVKG